MKKNVQVLLSTYNGEKYLIEQIESILRQKNVTTSILVRDDGSTDNTINILKDYQNKGILQWYTGDNLKPAKSFMDLLYHAPASDYYAFCDQDDVWLEDKLEIAVNILDKFDDNIPALYYGNPRLVDSNLSPIKMKSKINYMTDFNSALINSNATGCTMVFNKKLLDVVKLKKPEYIPMHDAWIHKVCIVFHGNLYYDKDVHILYRQHSNNVIGGSSKSMLQRLKGHKKSFLSKECQRSRVIKSLYECYSDEMSHKEKELAKLIINYKDNFICKMKLFFNRSIKTNYYKRNILYKIAVLFEVF